MDGTGRKDVVGFVPETHFRCVPRDSPGADRELNSSVLVMMGWGREQAQPTC